MALRFTTSYLEDSVSLFRFYKKLADGAIAQVPDERLTWAPGEETNSIAVIVKHLAGNMRSRWTGFPESDGEKPDRDRDDEFENPPADRAALLKLWEDGWECAFAALEKLSDADLERATPIRGEMHSVMQAVNRQLAHYAYHCGQIVLVARLCTGEHWKTLTIPRGQSKQFAERVKSGQASQR